MRRNAMLCHRARRQSRMYRTESLIRPRPQRRVDDWDNEIHAMPVLEEYSVTSN